MRERLGKTNGRVNNDVPIHFMFLYKQFSRGDKTN